MVAIAPDSCMHSLSEFEFSVPCEWDDYPCDKPATVMCKACSDDYPHAICLEHLIILQRWFDEQKPAVCAICNRPFMHFETHYSIGSV